MSTQAMWDELELDGSTSLLPATRSRRHYGRKIARFAKQVARGVFKTFDLLGVPAVAIVSSGAVRSARFDQYATETIAQGTFWLERALSPELVSPLVASYMAGSVPFLLEGVRITTIAVVLMQTQNFIPCIVLSEIARRQGRTISVLDLLIATSLPISATVAVYREGLTSLIALAWFFLAYVFCRISFHPKRVRGFLDWMVRLRGPMGVLGMGAGDVDGGDVDS